MGRNFPMVEITSSYPTLSLALFVVWMGALVVVVSSLCGLWSKPIEDDDDKTNTEETLEKTASSLDSPSQSQATSSECSEDRPLPPPPALTPLELGEYSTGKKRAPKMDRSLSISSLQPYISKHKSRKFSSSLSMRMPTKIKNKASNFKDKASNFKEKAGEIKADIGHHTGLKPQEESLWSKRIMIGGKCRLPSGDGDDEFLNPTSSGSGTRTSMEGQSNSNLDQGVNSTSNGDDNLKGKEIQYDSDT